MRPTLALAILAALTGCDEGGETGLDGGVAAADASRPDASRPDAASGDAGTVADAQPDPSDPLFARDRMLRVELDLAPADWDTLRAQTRTLETTLARESCLDEPFASPFTYFPARVRVDGAEYAQVGLRKKGFLGSLSDTKPSLKVKLDEYVADVEHLGLSTLAFNNGRQDPSLIKTCIGLERMRAAGVPTPRCGYAEIVVNGASLGPYVHIEDVGKRFLRRTVGEDQGHLYEGTVSDFRSGWTGTFEQEIDRQTPYDRSEIEALRVALERPDGELFGALEPLLDLDAFLRFWTTESLIEHWDGYAGNTNNFFLYQRASDGRALFVPWGTDSIFGTRTQQPFSVYAESVLARRLYLHPEGRPRYVEAMRARLAEWDAAAILAEIDAAAAAIAPAVPAPERAAVADATRALRAYVQGRPGAVRDELDIGGGEWSTPLRDRLCFLGGRVEASLETTFGTHPSADPFSTGTGTYTATVGRAGARGVRVGAAAGMGTNPDDRMDAVFLLVATLPDGSIPVLYVAIDPELVRDGALLPLDGTAVRGALLRFPRPGAPIEFVAVMASGYVQISRGSAAARAPVELVVVAELLGQRP